MRTHCTLRYKTQTKNNFTGEDVDFSINKIKTMNLKDHGEEEPKIINNYVFEDLTPGKDAAELAG